MDNPTLEQGTFNPASVTEIGILYYAVAGAFTVYTGWWMLIDEDEVHTRALEVTQDITDIMKITGEKRAPRLVS